MPSIFEFLQNPFGLNSSPAAWRVEIEENGRGGSVRYRDTGGRLSFYWEFGGANTLATIGVGTEADWRKHHPWAAPRRAEILRRIADEVLRQKAPGRRATIEDAVGFIHIL